MLVGVKSSEWALATESYGISGELTVSAKRGGVGGAGGC